MLLIWLPAASSAQPEPQAESPLIPGLESFRRGERVLLLAPHPDDESIGCAGIIQQALKSGAHVHVAYLTNGEHNEPAFIVYEKRVPLLKGEFIRLGRIRRSEAVKAMKFLGLEEDNLTFLGYPDSGTLSIFSRYWQVRRPYESLLTRISAVPYKENLSFGAAYTAENILNDLKEVLAHYQPTKIFVSHPADFNVDHKALYLFLEVALSDLEQQLPRPKVYSYLVHHFAWPSPRHYHPELGLEPPEGLVGPETYWFKFALSPEQLQKKHKAVLFYQSQTESSAFYLLAFVRSNELFGGYHPIELKRQVSLKEQAVQFFGFCDMFGEHPGSMEAAIERQGRLSYAAVDNYLLVRIEKNKEFSRLPTFSLYLFGYSYRTPFPQMPKITIMVRKKWFKVFDGQKLIAPADTTLTVGPEVILLKIPLAMLGSPDFIFTSLKAYFKALPFDAIAFRKVIIRD
jgi:LmbE family N-acetylglucosaminyl deacetylase